MTKSPESVAAGRARLVAAIAIWGTKAGAELIARQVFANAPANACMGVKPVEPTFTAAEQVERMAARAA